MMNPVAALAAQELIKGAGTIGNSEKILVDKKLLNINEFCRYLGIGKTKAREIMTKTNNSFTVRVGNRLYANKNLLDDWIDSISGNTIIK